MWPQLTQNMTSTYTKCKMWLQLRVEWGKCGKCDFNLHKILVNVKNVTSTYTKYEKMW